MNVTWLRGWIPRIKQQLGRCQPILLVIGVGVLLLLLPLGGGGEEREAAPAEQAEEFSLSDFEERLSQALSQIQGAGEVRVMLSLKSGSRQVLAQDTQRGADGDASASTVTLGRGAGEQEVVPLQTIAPQFQGALVVCSGGEDPQVCLQVTRGVSALTGLGSDRIIVCPSED